MKSKVSNKENDLDVDREGLNNIDMLRILLTQEVVLGDDLSKNSQKV